ncbi:DNA methyltransferase [Pseudobutyrivibrio sp.]|uniref:DNA methyltransferase n=1 Tax=Pseudobutyrivibrio sp. TaxID=2014367 RepID=UPI001B79F3A5|nr:DNA methyltransferase [Pseudobutyrivibrio sp.]MBP3261511.1 class I SAM-dependent DNA methyltransferase [Pseudobutyrivibrio sp.]
MTDAERREAARQFYQKWANRGREDEDDRSYWIDFLQDVMGVDHVTDRIDFQKKVVGPDGNTKRIDAYIPETRVLIEQKSLNIDLSKPQQGHNGMTPYEQAKMYDNSLPVSEKAKWIILSNFAEIWVYDMDTRVPEPTKFTLAEIPTKYSLFEFLVNQKQQKISQEMEISVKAGEFVGLIYDALLKQYINPENEDSLKSLNMLCVRLVFCLYAEDAHIFGENGHMFHDYMDQFETKDMRKALIELFKILDTPEDKRDPYDTSDLSKFPYVNGGLFADENIEIPNFTDEIRNILLAKASEGFDWSMISPTIFGAVFESTLNPETRRSGGMHYTSIENIHKVIDPLFLDDLKTELKEIKDIQVLKTRNAKLRAFQNKLASLTWLDPACGSGNFLTETYISIRRLENDVVSTLKGGQMQFVFDEEFSPIKVGIDQFYGIEINDFAVTVAKTALWIAESQMMKETEDILLMHLEFLPLKTNANIIEGNAVNINWKEIIDSSKLSYIMGNPPFVGARIMSSEQKTDVLNTFGKSWKNVGNLDYVCCWYKKACDYIMNTKVRVALVSTNSVSQGEQVANLWQPLFENGIHIDFAYRTFIWDSEAKVKAHVHCVIIGFSHAASNKDKYIFDGSHKYKASNINAYLIDSDNIFIQSRSKSLCNVPPIGIGNKPIDGGFYLFTKEEKNDFIKTEPNSEKYFKEWYGSQEFINRTPRYCLWLGNCSPNELRKMPNCMKLVESVRNFRLKSTSPGTVKLADTPTRFHVENMPESTYIIIPEVSSERRRYIPIGFMSPEVLSSNLVKLIPNANLYHFGILTSNVHMSWVRAFCGRLKSDYRYSKDVVYNNFPWPEPTAEQKENIEQTAQGILNARNLYPDSSLADLYDPLTMPPELQKAHTANDKAVMQAYGFSIKDTSEADCVAALMKMYQELTNN